jgi:hypothetical protein
VTQTVTLSCARCQQSAATFSLYPANTGEGVGHDRDRLVRTGFLGEVTKFGTLESLENLYQALAARNYALTRKQDPDFIAFHCWECNQDYCEQCWHIGPMEFDEGFYDSTHATCPNGHEQLVDD